MTEPRSKAEKEAGELSESTKTHLIDVYVRNKYNRFTEITSKYLEKGNDVEEDSITLLSRKTKIFFTKNTEQLKNDFICGTPDLFTGKDIYSTEIIRDTKSSWDVYTFMRAKYKDLTDIYYWQGMGYCWLTGAKKFYIDYCLNNTPYHIIEGLLRRESYNHLNSDTPAWIEIQIIANHVYDKKTFLEYIDLRGCAPIDDNSRAIVNGFVEIPLDDRHFCFEVERDDDEIERLKAKIMKSRIYIQNNFINHGKNRI